MAKRFFTKNKEKLYPKLKHVTVGNKSGKAREKEIVQVQAPKKQAANPKSPNIYQKITELRFSWKNAILVLFFLALGAVSAWQGYVVVQKGMQLKQVLTQQDAAKMQLALWENIAQKYPGYRDAYFQAAILAYRLGDREKEKMYLDKTLQIDPNFSQAKLLETK